MLHGKTPFGGPDGGGGREKSGEPVGSSGFTTNGSCSCGNSTNALCAECRDPVCSLCVRRTAAGEVCLACRSAALKIEDQRRVRALTRSGRLAGLSEASVRRSWIYFPALGVGVLALTSSVVGTVLSQAGTARNERRAREALGRIYDAEKAYRRASPTAFAPLEKLVAADLVAPVSIPGYALRVDVAKDGHTFWARAVPEWGGLRGMTVDPEGVVAFDGDK